MQHLKNLLFPGGFMPHGNCYLGTPSLIGLHVVSDSFIALAYLSIAATLLRLFIYKRRDILFRWMFLCLGAFIVACSSPHLMEVWTIWSPSYWLAGALKAMTAGIAVFTAALLIRITPWALAVPGPQRLLQVNQRLAVEIEQRDETESSLRRVREELEESVANRTAALVATNQSLQKSEWRYRTLVEHAPEAIVVLDLDAGRFDDAKQNAQRLFGINREELLHVGPVEVSPPFQPDGRPSSKAAPEELEKALHDETLRFEWMHCNAAGEEIPCEMSLVRLPSSGRNLVRASIIDISERKQAIAEIHKLNVELELRVKERTAQLEAANRDLEPFTYSDSHDLRAPLRHMDGFSRILVEEYGPQLPPGAKQHLERVRAASLHMGQLVDDLLNLARVGRGSLGIVTTDLNELVAETIQSLEAETRDNAVNWRVGRLSAAQCDPGLIRQVFFNLLSNALKFTRQREKGAIEIGEIGNQHDPVIFVRDNGVGFDMKYADKLFQVFQRLHGEEEFEGTGVGLAIVYRILQKHGGAIRAQSSPRNGATFFFTVSQPLPAKPAPVAPLGGAA